MYNTGTCKCSHSVIWLIHAVIIIVITTSFQNWTSIRIKQYGDSLYSSSNKKWFVRWYFRCNVLFFKNNFGRKIWFVLVYSYLIVLKYKRFRQNLYWLTIFSIMTPVSYIPYQWERWNYLDCRYAKGRKIFCTEWNLSMIIFLLYCFCHSSVRLAIQDVLPE